MSTKNIKQKYVTCNDIITAAVADKPARRSASRWTCCKQIRWTLSVINLRPN